MARLVWSARSEADLQSIHEHVGQDSLSAADELVTRIITAADRLTDFPLSGRIVPEFGREDIRELIVGNYRIVHSVVGDMVAVASVRHGARLLRY